MNKQYRQAEKHILENVAKTLQDLKLSTSSPRTEMPQKNGIKVDCTIEICQKKFAAEVVPYRLGPNAAMLEKLRERLARMAISEFDGTVLFVDVASDALIDLARKIDINVVGANGNAYIRAPGLFILLKGATAKRTEASRVLDLTSGINKEVLAQLGASERPLQPAEIARLIDNGHRTVVLLSLRRLEKAKLVKQLPGTSQWELVR